MASMISVAIAAYHEGIAESPRGRANLERLRAVIEDKLGYDIGDPADDHVRLHLEAARLRMESVERERSCEHGIQDHCVRTEQLQED